MFAYLAHFENVPLWNYAISDTRKTSSGPVGVGSRYRQTRTLPTRSEETFGVTEFEPDRRLSLRGSLGPFHGDVTYQLDATFPSVRLCELNTATGLPNLAAPLFQIAPFVGSPNGANEIPVGVTINDPDKVLFWAIQFPAQAPGFPANFPFLRMDFLDMERGLFANDYSISTAGTSILVRKMKMNTTVTMRDCGNLIR